MVANPTPYFPVKNKIPDGRKTGPAPSGYGKGPGLSGPYSAHGRVCCYAKALSVTPTPSTEPGPVIAP